MFLLRGMSHILNYVGSKIENFYDDLFDEYSYYTCSIMISVLLWGIDAPLVIWTTVRYGLSSPKAQQIMLFVAEIEFLICIVLSILTVIMESIDYSVAYYIRAVTMSFLLVSLILVGFAAVGFLKMLINNLIKIGT